MQVLQPHIFFPKTDCDDPTILHRVFFMTAASKKCMEVVQRVLYTLENCQGNIREIQEDFLRELESVEKNKEARRVVLIRLTMEWALSYYRNITQQKRSRGLVLDDALFREDTIREIFAVLYHDPQWRAFLSETGWRLMREELVVAGACGIRDANCALYGEEEVEINAQMSEWIEKPGDFQSAPLGQLFCQTAAQVKTNQEDVFMLISHVTKSNRTGEEMRVEQELLLRERKIDEYLQDHVKKDLAHLFQLFYILLLPRREVIYLETVSLALKIIDKCPVSHHEVFLLRLEKYIFTQFEQYNKEGDYINLAVQFRIILGERLGAHQYSMRITSAFDAYVSEQTPAYLSNFWIDGDVQSFLIKLLECFSIEQFDMQVNIDESVGKYYNEIIAALDMQIERIIQETPERFLGHMFGIFKVVSVNKRLYGWMEIMIKNYVARFIRRTGIPASKRGVIISRHEQGLQMFSSMLPVILQPIFEKLVNISRAQFSMRENYAEEPGSADSANGAKFRVM